MRNTYSILFFIAYLLSPPQLKAQFSTSFHYPYGQEAQVFPLEQKNPEESKILLFKYPSFIELVFLDQDLQWSRKLKCQDFPHHLNGKKILDIQNLDTSIQVIIQANERFRLELFTFNKTNGSYKTQSLSLEVEQEAFLNQTNLKKLHVFTYENRLYQLWIDQASPLLHIVYYNLVQGQQLQTRSIPLPKEALAERLRKKQLVPTPLIISPWDAQINANTKEEKIYMLGNELIISMENQALGYTYLWVLNTENWQLLEEIYPVKGHLAGSERQRFNSFLYEGFLYQVLFNKAGLHVFKVDFSTKESFLHKTWTSAFEFDRDFGFKTRRRAKGNSLRVTEGERLGVWRHLNKSLGLVLYPEDDLNRLIIGSHKYIDYKGRNFIDIARITLSLGSAVVLGLSVSDDPEIILEVIAVAFEPFNFMASKAYKFWNGKTFQGDTYLNTETFEVSSRNLIPADGDQIAEQISQENEKDKIYSICVFGQGNKIYIGFWQNQQYYIKELVKK